MEKEIEIGDIGTIKPDNWDKRYYYIGVTKDSMELLWFGCCVKVINTAHDIYKSTLLVRHCSRNGSLYITQDDFRLLKRGKNDRN